MNTRRITSLALVGLIGTALAGPAFATAEDREATALQSATVTLPQAIATAERQTGGKAFDAGVAVKGGATRISVETIGPHGVQTVEVDAQSGRVVGTHAGGEAD